MKHNKGILGAAEKRIHDEYLDYCWRMITEGEEELSREKLGYALYKYNVDAPKDDVLDKMIENYQAEESKGRDDSESDHESMPVITRA